MEGGNKNKMKPTGGIRQSSMFQRRRVKKLRWLFAGVTLVIGVTALATLVPHTALAQFDPSDAATAANQFGISTARFDLRSLIITIVKYLLGFVGLIAVIIVIYGGYLYMVSQGDAKKVELAKKVIINGLIGLVIIIGAYVIVNLITQYALNGFNNGSNNPNTRCTNCTALGGGIIEDHYPGRGATVPRNAHISITFKEGIFVAGINPTTSVDEDPDDRSLIPNAVNSIPADNSGNWTGGDSTAPVIDDAPPPIMLLRRINDDGTKATVGNKLSAVTNKDRRIFSFYNAGLLDAGKYQAIVKGGAEGLAKLSDPSGSAMGGDYEWTFNVSTEIDLTPPHIEDVVPVDTSTEARNTTVLITFSEPIDPMSVVTHSEVATASLPAGDVGDTIIIKQAPLAAGAAVPVRGIYDITNGYTTVTYRTTAPCGKNVCGNTLYCFDAEAKVDVEVRAATLLSGTCPTDPINNALRLQNNTNLACVNPGTTGFVGAMFDGIVDMAGNSFDGAPKPSGNAEAKGPPTDNYPFSFKTSSAIAISGPRIMATSPAGAAIGVAADATPMATFSRRLFKYTSDDFRIYSLQADGVHQNASMVPRWARQTVEYKCGVTGEACTPKNQQALICVGGSSAGETCTPATELADCGVAGVCTPRARCQGGKNNNKVCATIADCTDDQGQGVCPAVLECSTSDPAVTAADDKINSCGRSVAQLHHGNDFDQSGNKQYEPRLGPNILDQYQNCFSPTEGLANIPGKTNLKLDQDN